ncbi:RNA polymerase sigma factor SigJ [Thermomonospora catenispora]|uniref:RNA polymerase sigma factor SigJ n=1 Tax=Thermomonospora catenispora TaxID=2493090 RepID=UPI0011249F77|nr:RNA polymerase sigma factor SigJ [Thermomonospora catenispora]TNY35750.1 sigma-70 family RNA polymerase sigma factor [Thermomonospora catenispora]
MSDRLAEEWDRHRPVVFGVAYRILGSVADAEDVVQDVWLRAASADLEGVRDLRAWLTTVAARRAHDLATSARARREGYVGPWLPEPLLTGPDAAEPVLLDETVSTAMLLVLEELSPPERVAFVLRHAFEAPYERIAEVLGRSPAACRQLVSRARRRIAARRDHGGPRATRAERDRVMAAFRDAYLKGDTAALAELLDPDAVYLTDGGGEVFAARRPIRGGSRIAEVMTRVGRRTLRAHPVPAEINGGPGLLLYRDGALVAVDTVEISGGRIVAYHRVLNPAKLRAVRRAAGADRAAGASAPRGGRSGGRPR